MGQPWPLFLSLFSSFQTYITIFTTNKWGKCPSSKWRWDLNPQTLEHESPPITTWPGLPPETIFVLNRFITASFLGGHFRLSPPSKLEVNIQRNFMATSGRRPPSDFHRFEVNQITQTVLHARLGNWRTQFFQ